MYRYCIPLSHLLRLLSRVAISGYGFSYQSLNISTPAWKAKTGLTLRCPSFTSNCSLTTVSLVNVKFLVWPYRSDSVISSSVSHVSNPSATKRSRYWLSPSRARIGAKAAIDAIWSASCENSRVSSAFTFGPNRLLSFPRLVSKSSQPLEEKG